MTPLAWIGIDEEKKSRCHRNLFPWFECVMLNVYILNVVERCCRWRCWTVGFVDFGSFLLLKCCLSVAGIVKSRWNPFFENWWWWLFSVDSRRCVTFTSTIFSRLNVRGVRSGIEENRNRWSVVSEGHETASRREERKKEGKGLGLAVGGSIV